MTNPRRQIMLIGHMAGDSMIKNIHIHQAIVDDSIRCAFLGVGSAP